MKAKPRKRSRAAQAMPTIDCLTRQPGSDDHARIAAKAYELWRVHGGSAVANWLEAERLLRAAGAIATADPVRQSNGQMDRSRAIVKVHADGANGKALRARGGAV